MNFKTLVGSNPTGVSVKNTKGVEPFPTVVPQQICNPQRCGQRRDCVSLCLCLHDQCPRGVSVEILVALLRGENVLLRLAAFLLLPGAELLLAGRETKPK